MIEMELMQNLLQRKKAIENEIDYIKEEMEKVTAKYDGAGGAILSNESKPPINSEPDFKMFTLTHELAFNEKYNGMTLIQRLEFLSNSLNELEKEITIRKSTLSKFKGIKYDLYALIMIDGYNPSKAVNKIANDYDIDVSNVWKNHYKKIKKYFKK